MIRTIFVALAATALVAPPVVAQEPGSEAVAEQSRFDARAADVAELIGGGGDASEVFAESFLAQVPVEQFAAISQQLTGQFGAIVGVDTVNQTGPNAANITLRFEKALASGPMTLEAAAPYKVDGILLNDIKPINDGVDSITADIAALSGSKAAWFGPLDGDPIFTYGDAAQPFALGSTFKLYVLAALSRAVTEGRLSWDQVVPLDAKSYPSGIMQNWPDGAPVTLHTAATLMISISDNTATDLVMRAVGRDAIEAEMRASGHSDPAASFPFLSTREMFVLKSGEQGAAYAAADEAERRAMLVALDLNGVPDEKVMATFSGGAPVLVEDIEWYASMADQRALMRVLAALPDATAREIMAVSTALGEDEEAAWDYVGYKGGSEPGVLNLSWLLRDKAGRWHMLAISQLDPASEVDTSTLLMLAKRVLALAE